jgi:hypothetical protein
MAQREQPAVARFQKPEAQSIATKPEVQSMA